MEENERRSARSVNEGYEKFMHGFQRKIDEMNLRELDVSTHYSQLDEDRVQWGLFRAT
jgi:hypothetical protein